MLKVIKTSVLFLFLLLLPTGVLAADTIDYSSHVQDIGWSATRF